jgi:hypothetical protein
MPLVAWLAAAWCLLGSKQMDTVLAHVEHSDLFSS